MLAGFTKLRHYDAELCARLAAEAEKDMGNASGLQVAQIMWALAHQRYEQPGVFEAAAYQVCVCVCLWCVFVMVGVYDVCAHMWSLPRLREAISCCCPPCLCACACHSNRPTNQSTTHL